MPYGAVPQRKLLLIESTSAPQVKLNLVTETQTGCKPGNSNPAVSSKPNLMFIACTA
jgi:hypothetical protein